jgi:predicted GIY-YIG superfamily endonuclease
MAWFLYVLRCGDGTLYTGVTTDVERRLAEHAAGRGARYLRGRGPLVLLRAWEYPDERAAKRAEARVKRFPRTRKLSMVAASEPPCSA